MPLGFEALLGVLWAEEGLVTFLGVRVLAILAFVMEQRRKFCRKRLE
jgi:hypothetical protein